ncbi:MAG: RNA polymerase sigma-70 factor [Cytophagales bacterium]|nr:RNA polymerase sigma-70 factor [Cytophagales bacterium]
MTKITFYNDRELLRLIMEHQNHGAFEVLYQRHFDSIYRYVFKVMQDRETAEDVAQNIFISLWKKPPTLTYTSLLPYLFGAARNQISKEIRKNKWNREQLDYIENSIGICSTDEYLEEKDTRSLLENAVEKLPKKCRNVFELSRFGYLSNKQIAKKLGISVFTVENHIKKALYHLRQSLELVVILIFSWS